MKTFCFALQVSEIWKIGLLERHVKIKSNTYKIEDIFTKLTHLIGHGILVQDPTSSEASFSGQTPPFAGGGVLHNLFLIFSPAPHETEHCPKFSHCPHSPSLQITTFPLLSSVPRLLSTRHV